MAKIQTIGVGNYIRNPRGGHNSDSLGMNIQVLQIAENHGNSFLCFPVTDPKSVPVTVDKTKYRFIPIDANVEQVTI